MSVKPNNAIADLLDGTQASVGMKSDVTLDNFMKRLGANVPGFFVGMFTQGALVRKGMRELDPSKANQVVAATPGGAVTVRKF